MENDSCILSSFFCCINNRHMLRRNLFQQKEKSMEMKFVLNRLIRKVENQSIIQSLFKNQPCCICNVRYKNGEKA